ncbi:lysylphosphatidylglycerol synthase domain-containing protein [Amylibacter sp.]|nr:lysylphosphatidylglycerol synthase domain-containing protein [Amylibacter sp.]
MKLILTFLGILLLFWKLQEHIHISFETSSIYFGFLFFVAAHLFSIFYALRLKRSAAIEGITIPFFNVVKIHLQSQFYFFCIPVVGMDAARFLKIKNSCNFSITNSSMAKVLIYDRLAGIMGALIVSFACLPFLRTSAYIVALIIVSALTFLIIAASLTIMLARFTRLKAILGSVKERKRLNALVKLILVEGAISSAFLSISVVLGGLALGLEFDPIVVVLGASVAMLANAVPINLLGLGPSEFAMGSIFILLGISVEVSLALVSLSFLGRLIGAFEGAFLEGVSDLSSALQINGSTDLESEK